MCISLPVVLPGLGGQYSTIYDRFRSKPRMLMFLGVLLDVAERPCQWFVAILSNFDSTPAI
jgi:hypothetical protein